MDRELRDRLPAETRTRRRVRREHLGDVLERERLNELRHVRAGLREVVDQLPALLVSLGLVERGRELLGPLAPDAKRHDQALDSLLARRLGPRAAILRLIHSAAGGRRRARLARLAAPEPSRDRAERGRLERELERDLDRLQVQEPANRLRELGQERERRRHRGSEHGDPRGPQALPGRLEIVERRVEVRRRIEHVRVHEPAGRRQNPAGLVGLRSEPRERSAHLLVRLPQPSRSGASDLRRSALVLGCVRETEQSLVGVRRVPDDLAEVGVVLSERDSELLQGVVRRVCAEPHPLERLARHLHVRGPRPSVRRDPAHRLDLVGELRRDGDDRSTRRSGRGRDGSDRPGARRDPRDGARPGAELAGDLADNGARLVACLNQDVDVRH